MPPYSANNIQGRYLSDNIIWASPWRKDLKGNWVRDIAPSRKDRHKQSVQIKVTKEESEGLDVNGLKTMLRAKYDEAIRQS